MKPFKVPDNFPKPYGANMVVMTGNKKQITTKAGIIIPEGSAESGEAFVMAVGPECKDAKPGIRVVVDKNWIGINAIVHESNLYTVMPECAILVELPAETLFFTEQQDQFTKERRQTRAKETLESIKRDKEKDALRSQKFEDKVKAKRKKR